MSNVSCVTSVGESFLYPPNHIRGFFLNVHFNAAGVQGVESSFNFGPLLLQQNQQHQKLQQYQKLLCNLMYNPL